MKNNTTIPSITKEQIKTLKFPKEEVLEQKEDRSIRLNALQRAMALGNLEKEKVKIFFVDQLGLKKVETTVWGITEKYVILKQSSFIPLERIVSVA